MIDKKTIKRGEVKYHVVYFTACLNDFKHKKILVRVPVGTKIKQTQD